MSERNSLCDARGEWNWHGGRAKTLLELWHKTLLPRHGVKTPNPRARSRSRSRERKRGVCLFVGLVKEVRS